MRIDIFLSDYKGKIIVYEDIEKLEYMLQSLEADYASGLIAKDKYNYLHGQYLSKINNLKSGNVVIKDTSNQEKNMAQHIPKTTSKPSGNSSQWFSINKSKILIGLLAALCIFVVATVAISAGILDLDSNTKIVINSTNNTSSVNNTTDTSNDISDSGSSSSDSSSSGSSVSSGSSSGSSSSSHHSSGSSGGGSSSGGSSSGISPGTTVDGETEPPGLDA